MILLEWKAAPCLPSSLWHYGITTLLSFLIQRQIRQWLYNVKGSLIGSLYLHNKYCSHKALISFKEHDFSVLERWGWLYFHTRTHTHFSIFFFPGWLFVDIGDFKHFVHWRQITDWKREQNSFGNGASMDNIQTHNGPSVWLLKLLKKYTKKYIMATFSNLDCKRLFLPILPRVLTTTYHFKIRRLTVDPLCGYRVRRSHKWNQKIHPAFPDS